MREISILLGTTALLLLTGCKPDPYPKHPRYEIKKPKVRYKPSKKNLEKMVKKVQGSPYVWAEEGPTQFDCSGLTYYLYGSMGIELPRVAREQAKVGKRISPKELQYGDLIFFATDKRHPHKITHVGLYLGDGWFTHASTVKKEVIYSNLFTSRYYKSHLRICRRYLPESEPAVVKTQAPWKSAVTLPPADTNTTTPKGVMVASKAPQEATGNFYVQVGSFVGEPNQTLIYKITRAGYQHKIISFNKGSERISKLLVGPYPTHQEAEKYLEKIRQSIQPGAFIAEIR